MPWWAATGFHSCRRASRYVYLAAPTDGRLAGFLTSGSQYNVLHGPALREGNNYKYESTYVHAFGPYHPNPAKSAMLCVTANGFLKLFFPQNNNKIQETPLELESVTTSDDLITHASMCSEKSEHGPRPLASSLRHP